MNIVNYNEHCKLQWKMWITMNKVNYNVGHNDHYHDKNELIEEQLKITL